MLIRVYCVVLLAMCLQGQVKAQMLAPSDPLYQEMEKQLAKAVQSWNRGDLDGYLAYFWRSEQFVFDTYFFTLSGWDTYASTVRQLDRSSMKKMRYKLRSIVKQENGDYLVSLLHNLSGENTEALLTVGRRNGYWVCTAYTEPDGL